MKTATVHPADSSLSDSYVFFEELDASTSGRNSVNYQFETAATNDALLRRFVVACAFGLSDAPYFCTSKSPRTMQIENSASTSAASISGYVSELRGWLQRFRGQAPNAELEAEISNYARLQMFNNFYNFSRALRVLALADRKDVPSEAVAQLLIDSADAADPLQATLLGYSIEQYLDSDQPLLVDAAAKSLAPSRLQYQHAGKRMARAAQKTPYKYLGKKLKRVAEQLLGTADAEVRPEA